MVVEQQQRSPDFSHEYVDANGRPYTSLEMTYPRDGVSGSVTINISQNRTAEEKMNATTEFKNIADALKFQVTHIDSLKGEITVDTGQRNPEGFGLLVSSELQSQGMVVPGEGTKAIQKIIDQDPQQQNTQSVEQNVPDHLKVILNKVAEAKALFASAGGYSNDHEQQHGPIAPAAVPKVVEQNTDKGRGIGVNGRN